MEHVLKIDTAVPELNMVLGQAPLSLLTLVSLNINGAAKCIFASVTVFAIIAAWLLGQRNGFELHAVNFTNGPGVIVGKIGCTDQVLKLCCVDSGATSGCISNARVGLVKVSNSCLRAKVKVASGTTLPVVEIADLTLTDLSGLILEI